MKILLVHGPNLNLLGKRDQKQYGTITLESLQKIVIEDAHKKGIKIVAYQSNHEGALIDFIQENSPDAKGVIINLGALTHYSYALHDALVDTGLPAVEVHLSDVENREEWRKVSVTSPACIAKISGKKERGYLEALELLISGI